MGENPEGESPEGGRLEGGRTEDGRGDHLDWFFSLEDGADAPLVTWSTPVSLPHLGENISRHLPDHRARYLDYDGEISGSRGWVQRLVAGECCVRKSDAEQIAFLVDWAAVAKSSTSAIRKGTLAKFADDLCERLVARQRGVIRFVAASQSTAE